jgi:hypothetical protein
LHHKSGIVFRWNDAIAIPATSANGAGTPLAAVLTVEALRM